MIRRCKNHFNGVDPVIDHNVGGQYLGTSIASLVFHTINLNLFVVRHHVMDISWR